LRKFLNLAFATTSMVLSWMSSEHLALFIEANLPLDVIVAID
jgi:hypothetical protein